VPWFRQRVKGRFLLWLLHEQHGGGDLALVQGTHLQSTPPSSLRRPSAVPVILPLLCLSPCLLASVSTRSVGSDAMVISSCYCSRPACVGLPHLVASCHGGRDLASDVATNPCRATIQRKCCDFIAFKPACFILGLGVWFCLVSSGLGNQHAGFVMLRFLMWASNFSLVDGWINYTALLCYVSWNACFTKPYHIDFMPSPLA